MEASPTAVGPAQSGVKSFGDTQDTEAVYAAAPDVPKLAARRRPFPHWGICFTAAERGRLFAKSRGDDGQEERRKSQETFTIAVTTMVDECSPDGKAGATKFSGGGGKSGSICSGVCAT